MLVFESPRPFIYLPLERDDSLRTLFVRAKGDPALLARIEREIAGLAPDMPLADLRTMEQSLVRHLRVSDLPLGAIQAGGMGIIGLILAIVGVYGVVSFGASLRTREIGIRMALGAEPRDVLKLILGQGVRLVVVGFLIGPRGGLGDGPRAREIPAARERRGLGDVRRGCAVLVRSHSGLLCSGPSCDRVPVMTALKEPRRR